MPTKFVFRAGVFLVSALILFNLFSTRVFAACFYGPSSDPKRECTEKCTSHYDSFYDRYWVDGTACWKVGEWWYSHKYSCSGVSCSGKPKPKPKPVNKAPICDITSGPDKVYAGDTGRRPLTATWSDPDGSVVSHSWSDTVGGRFMELIDKTTGKLSFWWTPGPVLGGNPTNLNLTVTDNKGKNGSCTWPVIVVPGYTLTLKAWQKDAASSVCTTNSPLITNKVPYFHVYSSDKRPLGQGATDGQGSFKVQISRTVKDLKICGTYAPPNSCVGYGMTCAPSPVASNCFTYTVTVPDDFTNPSDLYIGFEEQKKPGWVSAIDGNIQAFTIGGNLPCNNSPLGGNFSSTMINLTGAYSATSTKGYIFTKNAVNNAISSLTLIEDQTRRGGWAFNNNDTDAYLDKLSFKAPTGSSIPSITNLNVKIMVGSPPYPRPIGRVYKINVSDFNALTAAGATVNYRFSSLFGPGWVTIPAPLVYVEGGDGDEMIINAPILSADAVYPNLLFITDLPVRITKNVGIAYNQLSGYPGYTELATPNIEAAIISSKTITVERDENIDAKITPDKAIMLQGPLVSLAELQFNRDAGYHNDEFPPQAVKYNSNYLYYLTQLERTSQLFKSYTGIGIYDLQWIYDE